MTALERGECRFRVRKRSRLRVLDREECRRTRIRGFSLRRRFCLLLEAESCTVNSDLRLHKRCRAVARHRVSERLRLLHSVYRARSWWKGRDLFPLFPLPQAFDPIQALSGPEVENSSFCGTVVYHRRPWCQFEMETWPL
jgi:hypothetical protein